MHRITVKKDDLRKAIQKNRDGHRAIFEEAVEGYRKEAVKLLEGHIARIKSGKVLRVSVSLPEPSDHTSDYDRILAMLDMSVDDEILLDENDFAAYVMDDWVWKSQFITTNSAYSAMARSLQ